MESGDGSLMVRPAWGVGGHSPPFCNQAPATREYNEHRVPATQRLQPTVRSTSDLLRKSLIKLNINGSMGSYRDRKRFQADP